MANYINKFKTQEEWSQEQYKLDYPQIDLIDNVLNWVEQPEPYRIYIKTPTKKNGIPLSDGTELDFYNDIRSMGFDSVDASYILSGSNITSAVTNTNLTQLSGLENGFGALEKLLNDETYPSFTSFDSIQLKSSEFDYFHNKFPNVKTAGDTAFAGISFEDIPSYITAITSNYVINGMQSFKSMASGFTLHANVESFNANNSLHKGIWKFEGDTVKDLFNLNSAAQSYIFVKDELLDEYNNRYSFNGVTFKPMSEYSSLVTIANIKANSGDEPVAKKWFGYDNLSNGVFAVEQYYKYHELDINDNVKNVDYSKFSFTQLLNAPENRQDYVYEKVKFGDCAGDLYGYSGRYNIYVPIKEIVLKSTPYHYTDGTMFGIHFAFNYALETVTFEQPELVEEIPSDMFYNCRFLKNITLPSGLKRIGDNAFCGAFVGPDAKTEITIPSGVTHINRSAFQDGLSLTSITLSDSLTSIGSYAFSNCSKLQSVTVRATTPPTLGNDAFYGTPSTMIIYVPAESVEAYKTASEWSNYADRIQAIPTE